MSSSESPGLSAPWVAIVDDHVSVRTSLARALRLHGIAAEGFASVEDYLRDGHLAKPCCLVLDVQLPGLSGFDLQRELATTPASAPPIIMISAHAENLSSSNGTLRGVCGCLQKPFAIDALLELVRPHYVAA
jgi:FixJ family two-component response regulator